LDAKEGVLVRKLVLFDVDGTLIESSRAHVMAFSQAFREVYGIDTTIEVIEHHGMTDRTIIAEVMKRSGVDESVIARDIEACVQTLAGAFERTADRVGVSVLPGVRDLLRDLHESQILMGLVTGNLEAIAWSKLRRVDLDRYLVFGAFGSDRLERRDLVSLAVHRASEQWGFECGGGVFFFGDTPRDVEAARETGVTAVAVTTGIYGRPELERAGAHVVFDDLTDRESILRFVLS
jgi:phosphoglycolate phosphatase-like HAD superfamily hydrolase